MTIGERIKQRRLELGLTQTELAKKLGYTNRASICSIETNRETNLSPERVERIAKALETTAPFLMYGETERIVGFPTSRDALSEEMLRRAGQLDKIMEIMEKFDRLPEDRKALVLQILDTWGVK